MDPIEVIKLGMRMRQAQREYFRTRSGAAMQDAKALEKRFDVACRELLEQPTLFNDLAGDLAKNLRPPAR
jgi:hypothetical protein